MPTRTKQPRSFTHVGSRAYVGAYRVTADAYRTEGETHALNFKGDGRGVYVALCGVAVTDGPSDDHFLGDNPIVATTDPAAVTCSRCRRALGLSRWAVQFHDGTGRGWLTLKDHGRLESREAAEAVVAIKERTTNRAIYRWRVKRV